MMSKMVLNKPVSAKVPNKDEVDIWLLLISSYTELFMTQIYHN
jgi:hypothetical protein